MQSHTPSTISKSRLYAFMVVTLILVYALSELTAYGGLRLLASRGKQGYAPTLTSSLSDAHREILTRVANGEARYIGYSRTFGWTTLPNGKNELYEANSQGVRGTREYPLTPPPGTLRIAAFGDSFIHGDDVPNPDAWSIMMERSAPNVEVMNFGVGGHGPDQGYLRYLEEGRKYSPHIVFIGYQTENINRVVNVFRPFYSPTTGNPLAKPYFRLIDGDLVLRDNPIESLSGYRDLLDDPANVLATMSQDDFHYKFRYKPGPLDWSPLVRLLKVVYFEFKSRFMSPLYEDGRYRTSSEAYQLLTALIEDFHCDTLENGSLPVVVLFPNRGDLASLAKGKALEYQPLKENLLASGYPVLDLADAFAPVINETELNELILGHYTRQGNELVSDFILAEIGERDLLNPEARAELMAMQSRQCGE